MTKAMPEFADRIAGGLIGLLVGDALGVPYEFNAAELIPAAERIEYSPPADFRRSHASVPPGTWSDDGAHALCLLASLLHCDGLDLDDFGSRLVRWYDAGYMAVDGCVFDVGVTTASALRAVRAGTPADSAGDCSNHANGNGSLMRVLPLVLWHRGSDAQLVADAQRQSLVTHGHLRAQVCCALYCLFARRLLNAVADPWSDAVATLRRLYVDDAAAQEELEWSIRPDEPLHGQGSGYVVDCLRSALICSAEPDYERAVRAAIRLGRDTDTTACVTGGLVGIRDGIGSIPQRWREALRGRDIVEPLLQELLRRRG